MAITIEQGALARVVASASRATEKRNTAPILGNVLLSGCGGRLSITGTNLDIEVKSSADAGGDIDDVTVPAHTLNDIVRKLPKGAVVSINAADEHVTVKAGRSRFKVPSLPAADWPTIQQVAYDVSFSLTSNDVHSLFGKTRHAISSEETRYYLNGAYLHIDGDKLAATATDGHRLAVGYIPAPDGASALTGVIVPARTIPEIIGMATGGNVKVELSQRGIRASTDDTVITSKLVDGAFPDYRRIVPTSNTNIAQINREAFGSAVDRVLTATPKSRAVKVTVAPGGITLETRSSDGNEAADDIEATYHGEPIVIGFNGRYLQDHLNAIKGHDTIELQIGDPGSPALIRAIDDDSWRGVVMPMRV